MNNEKESSDSALKDSPWPRYSEAFQFVKKSDNGKNYVFTCKLCPLRKTFNTSTSSSSNLKKHLTGQHPSYIKKLEKSEKTKENNSKRKASEMTEDEPPLKQMLLRGGSGNIILNQGHIDQGLTDLIIEENLPITLVDKPAFINFARLGLPKSVSIMCSKTLKTRIESKFTNMLILVKEGLSKVEAVCTTTDLWSKSKRSYIGMTAHWLDPDTLKRKSAALACRRLTGKHTFDVLAKEINDIHKEYHIQNKVIRTVTDGASNFAKAFRTFSNEENNAFGCGSQSSHENETPNNNVQEQEEEIIFHNMFELLNEPNSNMNTDIILPAHQRCICHTINLIATVDVEKGIQNASAAHKKIFRSCMAKCSKLWSKQNQSTQTADHIKMLCGVYLKTPGVTRWNSTYDAMAQINNLMKDKCDKIQACMDFGDLPRFSPEDMKFIAEYCEVMKPIADALDTLQGDQGMFMGYLLPVLKTVKEKLQRLKLKKLHHCIPIITAIDNGLDKRCKQLFQQEEFVISSCLHPRFKLNWLKDDSCQLLSPTRTSDAIAKLKDLLGISPSKTNDSFKSEEDDFFTFDKEKSMENEEELNRFLNLKRVDLAVFNDFPRLKKLFIQYDTALPSSAPCERLFSTGGMVMCDDRRRMTDALFEQKVLLKLNKNYK